jgi:hypothetical protein
MFETILLSAELFFNRESAISDRHLISSRAFLADSKLVLLADLRGQSTGQLPRA